MAGLTTEKRLNSFKFLLKWTLANYETMSLLTSEGRELNSMISRYTGVYVPG